jgi:CBS domain containing-hemolysin-like protein
MQSRRSSPSQPAEQLTWNGWRFQVLEMDGSRIHKMLVEPTRTLGSRFG